MRGALLDPQSADRLRKLCGMLGSAHDGERASAALKADQFVRRLGLTWADIISPPIVPDPPFRCNETDWQRMARFCYARQGTLSARDREFVASIFSRRGTPSDKQQAWLIDVYLRCGGSR